jgi:hypothetical protein
MDTTPPSDNVNVLKAPDDNELNETMDTTPLSDNVNVIKNENSTITPPKQEEKLVNIEVNDQTTALNLMVTFLSLANKRGVFSLDESAKIWECVKQFQ